MTRSHYLASAMLALACVAPCTIPRANAVPVLLVSSGDNDAVLRYNATTGAFIDVFASGGGLDDPEGLAIGPDGNLYVTSRSNEVLRYDGVTGAFLGVFASGGGLEDPAGLVFGADGRLYVSSGETGDVKRFDAASGEFFDTFTSGGDLVSPEGLRFGPEGDLFVNGGENDAVLRIHRHVRHRHRRSAGTDLPHGRQSLREQRGLEPGAAVRRNDGGVHRRVRRG
jgi:streptogramin lyase